MIFPTQGQAGPVKLGPLEHLPSHPIGVSGDSSLVASFSKTATLTTPVFGSFFTEEHL